MYNKEIEEVFFIIFKYMVRYNLGKKLFEFGVYVILWVVIMISLNMIWVFIEFRVWRVKLMYK